MKKGSKRKVAPASRKDEAAASTNEEHQRRQRKETTRVGRATKRPKFRKPESEPELLDEHRESDLWKQVFPVGTEWGKLGLLSEYKWSFTNLEDAFEEGGVLHGKKVYLFTSTEPQMLLFGDKWKEICIPAVVAVVSPFPPSDKIGITSVQKGSEEILDMKHMKMDWVPYIPLGKRDCLIERLKPQIFILSCVQRRAGLKHLKQDRVVKFGYCLPYFYHPSKEDETLPLDTTSLNIVYPLEPSPVVIEFDWELDDIEAITDLLIAEKNLPEDQKDAFKEHVNKKVEEEIAILAAWSKEKRKKAREEMSPEIIAAYDNMELYKFYPVATPDTPDISSYKSPFVNRYYGRAHQLF